MNAHPVRWRLTALRAAFAAVLLTIFPIAPPPATATPSGPGVAVYAYDGHHHTVNDTYTGTEPGPPSITQPKSTASSGTSSYLRSDDMPYRLDPQVAGELGDNTLLDSSTHPPTVGQVDYVLDQPDADGLIQSFPVFLVSTDLGSRWQGAGMTGFALSGATVRPSDNYIAIYGDVPPPEYLWLRVTGTAGEADCWLDDSFQLCVSDRFMRIIDAEGLADCLVEPIPP